MRKRSLLALLVIATFAGAVAAGLGASAASAGEVTGNCNHAKSEKAAANCKTDQNVNANSECSFSGQNDNPEGSPEDGIGGKLAVLWAGREGRPSLPRRDGAAHRDPSYRSECAESGPL